MAVMPRSLFLPLLLTASNLAAADSQLLPLRNHNPFLQIYGLPPFQAAPLTAPGRTNFRFNLAIANHADAGLTGGETVVIDGESYFLNFSWRRGWSERLETGIDVPLVSHNRGFLDSPIERWHDLFGLSNANRNGPHNRMRFFYSGPGGAGYSLNPSSAGLGDIQLSSAYSLRDSTAGGGLTLRSSLKLPSGDPDRLTGSGAADFSLGLYATDASLFGRNEFNGSAFTGILLLGEGEVLPSLQKNTVGFVGISASWQLNDRLALHGQLYGQGAYYESKVDEIGGNSLQFAVGGAYRPSGSRLTFSLGIIEDLFSDATTDVAFHFSILLHRE
jgi:hypothetical protein